MVTEVASAERPKGQVCTEMTRYSSNHDRASERLGSLNAYNIPVNSQNKVNKWWSTAASMLLRLEPMGSKLLDLVGIAVPGAAAAYVTDRGDDHPNADA